MGHQTLIILPEWPFPRTVRHSRLIGCTCLLSSVITQRVRRERLQRSRKHSALLLCRKLLEIIQFLAAGLCMFWNCQVYTSLAHCSMSTPYGAFARWKQFQTAMHVSDEGVKTFFWKWIKKQQNTTWTVINVNIWKCARLLCVFLPNPSRGIQKFLTKSERYKW